VTAAVPDPGGGSATTASTELREVRPGLYERPDTPREVTVTREFADAVRKHSGSSVLGEILDDVIREQDAERNGAGKRRPKH
jgi:hypothetical protein